MAPRRREQARMGILSQICLPHYGLSEPQPRCTRSQDRLRRRVRSCRASSPCGVSLNIKGSRSGNSRKDWVSLSRGQNHGCSERGRNLRRCCWPAAISSLIGEAKSSITNRVVTVAQMVTVVPAVHKRVCVLFRKGPSIRYKMSVVAHEMQAKQNRKDR